MDVEVALQELRRRAPRAHLVVEMYYRGGYSPAEIADAILVSARTVERELSVGRAWLQRQLAPASA
jgi:DNA-directed RNA polymerase specialized sigma24 family protein